MDLDHYLDEDRNPWPLIGRRQPEPFEQYLRRHLKHGFVNREAVEMCGLFGRMDRDPSPFPSFCLFHRRRRRAA